MPNLELTVGNLRDSDHFEVGDRYEVPDLELALADNRQRWRLHATDADDAASPLAQDHRGRAGEGKIVDLVGRPSCDGGGIQAGILGVWLGLPEGIPDGLGILRGEQDPHDLASILVVLENLLADQ